MTQPTVCAIMLTADRPDMAARAVRSFRAQTHENKRLLTLDTGRSPQVGGRPGTVITGRKDMEGFSIGRLRNEANAWAREADILIHWDDDDVSHANRISEQVEHLVSSGADAVGYSDLLFWKEPRGGLVFDEANASRPGNSWPEDVHRPEHPGEAWLYTSVPNSCPGTSLCYWRRTWERKPFPDQPRPGFADGEDVSWVRYLNLKTVSSIPADDTILGRIRVPRLIASVHGRNTSGSYKRIGDPDNNFKRVPEWDDYCRRAMSMNSGQQFSGNPTSEASGHQVEASGNRPSSQNE